jgi:hypothetical protein
VHVHKKSTDEEEPSMRRSTACLTGRRTGREGAERRGSGGRRVDLMQGIGRDIATGEAVEAELDNFISRRHDRRVADEGERETEAAWVAAEKRLEARRRREVRAGWYSWHLDRASLYARLSREHEAAAEGLMGESAA